MRKKDLEQLAEIALRANAGDEAQACKMTKRLWRVRRWAAEQAWRAEKAKDDGRRGILERIGTSVDGVLHELEQLKAHDNAPAREATPAASEPARAAPTILAEQKSALRPAEDDGPLVPKSTEEKADLAIAAEKSGAKA